ncbi:hypothetical protein [Sinorhizobium sp. Sb3]|uniref:hypothetical protein n=1 Tax=Sinorhizobium/Ensifer group TaxID=227292 RepID=UPI00071E59D6|nr:hypothetical protein [Sinorhizobium sp. Sb3]KSV68182.1 hypothetical protein N183_31525 [Sinorhizobium sp. Sb3]
MRTSLTTEFASYCSAAGESTNGQSNVQAIATSIEPSSFFVTDGVEVDDTEMSIHGKRMVLERVVMGGERGLSAEAPSSVREIAFRGRPELQLR